jgi:predicted TIM-barrel fold metal-dependent hydrolase
MEIVDAQVHLNQLVPDWQTASDDSTLATALVTMDAVGLDTVLIGEARGFDRNMRPALGTVLPNGAVRASLPFSERAMQVQPDRFGYTFRVDRRDPELEREMDDWHAKPGAVCIRIVPVPQTGEVDALERGEYEPLFAAADQQGVPVFCWLPARGHLLAPYLKKFPRVQFILDHCGVGVAPFHSNPVPPTMATSLTPTRAGRVVELDTVLELAQYPNLALKWCHAPNLLSEQPYPYRDVLPLLRKAISAFGADRIMWASDWTQARNEMPITWSQALHYVLDSDELSSEEKEWLLGKSVRQALKWPRPAEVAAAASA